MKKILVADDDRGIRNLLREVLRKAGYSVATTSDGAAALERLHKQKFDLLLLDVWMPKKTGLEILAALRENKSRLKVIVMTGDDAPETLLQAVREQAFHYIRKPFEVAAILQMVRDSLARKGVIPRIEIISAKPAWVELLVPCTIEAAERIEGFMSQLKADLAPEARELVGQAFHELLLNAVEWGGKLNPRRKVRIAFLRMRRMLLYRIADPGQGFRFEDLTHAAVNYSPDAPTEHDEVRKEKGIRPGGFGLLITQTNADELIYNEKQNEVVFVKYLEA
ncbi:MAG: response regulator [Candidatus Acidiferrales bacterium]